VTDRTQTVKVGATQSSAKPLTSGVAQGSVLGPLLFILYINDLPQYINPLVKTKIFANDVKLYATADYMTPPRLPQTQGVY